MHSFEQNPLPPELAPDANRAIVAQGTRITLFLILRGYFGGMSWPELAEQYPTVAVADWPAIAAYVEQNSVSLRTFHEGEEKVIAELRKANPSNLSLEILRERFRKKTGKSFPRL